MKLPKNLEKKVEEIVMKTGVLGWDREFQPRIKAGKVVPGIMCIRIFVEKKKPLSELKPFEVLPASIDDIEVDVVEIGYVKAWESYKLSTSENTNASQNINPAGKVRPLVMGVSVGNIKITAGTDGTLYYYKGDIVEGSNGHVFCSSVIKDMKEQYTAIVQPGPFHGGKFPDDLKGHLIWYNKLEPYEAQSKCPLASGIVSVVNTCASLLHAKSRLKTIVSYENNDIDFAVASIEVPYIPRVLDIPLSNKKLAGHVFAMSENATIFCHVENIRRRGIEPAAAQIPYDAQVDDVLEFWSWRLEGYHRTTKVITRYANLLVDYGRIYVMMTNVGIGTAAALPGCSGSALFLKEK